MSTTAHPMLTALEACEMEHPREYRLAVDIGGTFTDIALLNLETGQLYTNKVPTTELPAEGVISGIQELLADFRVHRAHVAFLIHATTLVTNAVIQRTGAAAGLMTTTGFADAIDVGRETRYDLYDLSARRPEPLVPRRLRVEIDERTLADGAVDTPISRDNVLSRAAELIERGAQSLAVCFLHSYRNADHEEAAGRWIRAKWPNLDVSLSSDICPEIGEYERMSTTIINAYTQPLARQYLDDLSHRLRSIGLTTELHIMLSSGGTTTLENARACPVRLMESGPTAAALAAAFARRSDNNIVAFDMGGTTAKICLIHDSSPSRTYQFEVARIHRFKPGSGLPVKSSALDLLEIGAGGGSIAYVDSLGLMKVGPRSAAAFRGPACYGFGGVEPTVTDAALLLGYLDPDGFLGGEMKLHPERAKKAIHERLAVPLSLDVLGAAQGIVDVVNENMARAMQVHFAERGKDPRQYALVATGGAAPLHAVSVAHKVGIPRVIFPPATGVASALGLLASPIRVDDVVTVMIEMGEQSWPRVAAAFERMESRAKRFLDSAPRSAASRRISRLLEVRYRGQGHSVQVPLANGEHVEYSELIADRFREVYRSLFEHEVVSQDTLEVVNCRLTIEVPVRLQEYWRRVRKEKTYAGRRSRRAFLPEDRKFDSVRAYYRETLPVDVELEGPALIEEWETTIFIPARVPFAQDRSATIVVRLDQEDTSR